MDFYESFIVIWIGRGEGDDLDCCGALFGVEDEGFHLRGWFGLGHSLVLEGG